LDTLAQGLSGYQLEFKGIEALCLLAKLSRGTHLVDPLAADGADPAGQVHVEGRVKAFGAEKVTWKRN
jgi:hypothetical protein